MLTGATPSNGDGGALGPGVGAFDQATVPASSAERWAGPDETETGSLVAGTVISSLQEGHFANASARDSVVVSSLPQRGQLNSIATLRFRSSPRP